MHSEKITALHSGKVVDAPRKRGKAGHLAAAAALVGCFAWLSFSSSLRESAAFDESYNIVSGWALRVDGRLPAAQPTPPLLLRWLALPLPAGGGKLLPFSEPAYLAVPRTYGFNFIYSNIQEPGRLLNVCRAANILLGVLLALLGGLWAFRLGGRTAGLAALFLFAFMPPLLAHSHLATSDIGNALLCTTLLYLLWRGERSPSLTAALAAGLGCGLALAGKYTAVLLVPLALGCLYAWRGHRIKLYACFTAGALAGLWLGCWPVSLREWLVTGLDVAKELGAGHITYLAGKVSGSGSWYYFPLALLLKTPLPALLLCAAGFYLLRPKLAGREPFLYLLLPLGAWLLLGVFSNTQVGIRHLLPVYPLLCVWGGLAAARLLQAGKSWLRAAAWALFLWLAAGTLAAFPWYVSYFNELAAGRGYRYLLDSNLDWGQGLKELGAYAKAAGAGHIYLSYFGCADPHAYGLKYSPVLMATCTELRGDGPPPPGQAKQLLAVSVNNRFGLYYPRHDIFSWLDGRRPEKIAGDSIWIYDVTGDTEALRLLSFPGLRQ